MPSCITAPASRPDHQTTPQTGSSSLLVQSDSEQRHDPKSSPYPLLVQSSSPSSRGLPPSVAEEQRFGRASGVDGSYKSHTGFGIAPPSTCDARRAGLLQITSLPSEPSLPERLMAVPGPSLQSSRGGPVSSRRPLSPLETSPVASPSTLMPKSCSNALPPRGLMQRPDPLTRGVTAENAPQRKPPLLPSVLALDSSSEPRPGGPLGSSNTRGRAPGTSKGAHHNLVEALDAECDAVLGGGVAAILAKHNYRPSSARPSSLSTGRSESGRDSGP